MSFKSLTGFMMIFLLTTFSLMGGHAFATSVQDHFTNTLSVDNKETNDGVFIVVSDTEGKEQQIEIPIGKILFQVHAAQNNDRELTSFGLTLKPELLSLYPKIMDDDSEKTIFVYPVFTQAAYEKNGFYDYYAKKCDSKCLTIPIPTNLTSSYATGAVSSLVLTLLNYSFITDIDIDLNPDILKKYDKVILLHNEYVTKKEFDAITNHPNVTYLFPNALYAEVSVDYNKNTFSLVRGHSYPEMNISNGFNWKFDNSKYEYNVQCTQWNFYKIENGVMLNCYPNYRMLYDESLLRAIKSDHTFLLNHFIEPQVPISDIQLMQNFGIRANHFPHWIDNTTQWFVNGNVSEQEFVDSILYLYKNRIIS